MDNPILIENKLRLLPLGDLVTRYRHLVDAEITNVDDIDLYQNTPMPLADIYGKIHYRFPGLGALEALNLHKNEPQILDANSCLISSAGFLGIDPRIVELTNRNIIFEKIRKSGREYSQVNSTKASGFTLLDNEELKYLGLGNKFLALYQVIIDEPVYYRFSHAVAALRYPDVTQRDGTIYQSNEWMYLDTRKNGCPLIPQISTEGLLGIIGSEFMPRHQFEYPPVQFISFPQSLNF